MAFRTLLITLVSGEKLPRPFRVFRRMDVYAFVSISDNEGSTMQEARTTVDHGGDANPRWRCRIEFEVDEAALQANRLALDFKLMCKRWLADEVVGDLTVPVKDLLDFPAAAAAGGGEHSVTYDVPNPRRWPKGGKLTFSFKFGEKIEPKLVQLGSAQAQIGMAQTGSEAQPKGKRKRCSG